MAGFTAINAPAREQPDANAARKLKFSITGPSHLSTSRDETRKKTIVSDYLGRDRADTFTPHGGRLEGNLSLSGPAKAAGRGKKRTSTAGHQSIAKKRKTEHMRDGLRITKDQKPNSKSRLSEVVGQHDNGAPEADPKSRDSSPQTTCGSMRQLEGSLHNHGTSAAIPQTVSVMVPPNSWDNLHSGSFPTSLDAVRSSAGHGTTLYKSADGGFGDRRALQHTQLFGSSALARSFSGATANTKETRPRRAAHQATNSHHARRQNGRYDAGLTSFSHATQHDTAPSSHPLDNDGTSLAKKPSQHRDIASPSATIGNDGTNSATKLSQSLSSGTTNSKVDEVIQYEDCNAVKMGLTFQDAAPSNRHPKLSDCKSAQASKSKNEQATSIVQILAPSSQAPVARTESHGDESDTTALSDCNVAEIEELMQSVEGYNAATQKTPPPLDWKRNIHEVDKDENYGSPMLLQAERRLLEQLKEAEVGDMKPVVRKAFPTPIQDRSPLFGVSNTTMLRTCFRLGEALNAGSQAVRSKKNVAIELYARVIASWREPKPGKKQHFVFRDLYHDKPPHLEGSYERWSQGRLWDLDSKVFPVQRKDGIMCRVMAQMRREGSKWKLDILSIWKTSWEDIDFVAGIYAKDDELENGLMRDS